MRAEAMARTTLGRRQTLMLAMKALLVLLHIMSKVELASSVLMAVSPTPFLLARQVLVFLSPMHWVHMVRSPSLVLAMMISIVDMALSWV